MAKDHISMLQPGFYIGIIRSTMSFRLDEDKFLRKGGSQPVQSFEDLFERYAPTKPRIRSADERPKGDGNNGAASGKTTSHSGWILVGNPDQVRNKAMMAPEVYKASGGSDPELAEAMVRNFKKTAAKELASLAESGAMDDEVIAGVRRINKYACSVQMIRVKLLWVSETPIEGGRQSGQAKPLWYKEVCLRKFYLTDIPQDELLTSFAEAIANPTLVVNSTGHLVVRRSDGTADGRRKSSFSITRAAWRDSDQDVKRVVDWVKQRSDGARGGPQ